MRYIFRGKRKEDGVWVYGDLEHNGDIDMRIQGFIVISDTVGQFTGMKDGKDNHIFENDIVQIKCGEGKKEKKNYLVVYVEVDACYYLSESEDWNPCDIRSMPLGRQNTYYIKKIGNIHDNSELLSKNQACA